jgi:hypothetical protein
MLSSLEPATGPYTEPYESNPHPSTILLYDTSKFYYYSQIHPKIFQVIFFLQLFYQNFVCISHLYLVYYVALIS